MKKKNAPNESGGLLLDAPLLRTPVRSFSSRFLFYFPFLFLGVFGMAGSFFSAFSIPVPFGTMFLGSAALCAAFTALFLLGRRRQLLILPLLGCWLLALLFFRESFVQGFIRTVNYIVTAYSKVSDYSLTTYQVKGVSMKTAAVQCTAFSFLVLFLIILLMAWLLIRRKKLFLCFAITLPFLSAPLAFTIIPHYAPLVCLLAFWGLLLLNASSLRRGQGLRPIRRGFQSLGDPAARPAGLALLAAAGLCLALSAVFFPAANYQRPKQLDDLRQVLMEGPKSFTALMQNTGIGNHSSRVDLQSAGNLRYTGRTVLRVNAGQHSETEYLKSYVGSVYTGLSWEPLPDEDNQELYSLFQDFRAQNLPWLFSQRLPTQRDMNVTPYDIAIENVGANSKNVFIPYTLVSNPLELPEFNFVADGYVNTGSSLFGSKSYTLQAGNLNIGAMLDYSYQTRMTNYYWDQHVYSSVGDGGNWEFGRVSLNPQQPPYSGWEIGGDLRGSLNNNQQAFVNTLQSYNRFVREKYTQLPENLKEKLTLHCEQNGLSVENYPDMNELVQATVNLVQRHCSYTLEPGVTPQGRDFVDYFLFENQKGYCVHFATATAALLRSLGIPSRYAEGYCVNAGDYIADNYGWANIQDFRAHAWVEIYVGGVGWVPVEATPAGSYAAGAWMNDSSSSAPESPQPPESSSGLPPSSTPSSSSDTPSSPSVPASSSPAPGGKGEANAGSAWLFLLLLPCAALLLAVGLLLFRNVRLAQRRRAFGQKDYNRAALAVYAYVERLIHRTGANVEFTGELPEDLWELVLRARFSQHTLTPQEVRRLADYAASLAEQIRKKLPRRKQLACKYIHALW